MADVTIRGAGIFGLSLAWICRARGAKVTVVDPHGPGAGASGGLVGALAPHVPENWNSKKAFQLESLLASQAFWAEIEAASGLSSGYGRTGRLQPIGDAHARDLAQARRETAKTLWQGKADWQITSAEPHTPWCPPSGTGEVIHDTLSARLHPRRACAALVAALSDKGVTITRTAPDQGRIIWATGAAGLEHLSAEMGKSVGTGIKGQAALLDYDAGQDAPQLFIDGLHIIPHADSTTAIGSTTERDFTDPHGTDAALDDLIARARAALPVLQDAQVLERWAGLRPRSKSRAPMLGAYPDRPGHFIANGGFKIGFGMAVGIANVMADLVLDDRDQIPDEFRIAASL